MKAMKTMLIIILVIVLAIAAMFFVGAMMGGDKDRGQAVDFTVTTIMDASFTLSQNYEKSGTVLVFFDRATAQSPALLENLGATVKGKNVKFVLVAVGETDQAALAIYLSEAGVAPDVVIADGKREVAEKYNINSCPVTYFINSTGSVRQVSLSNLNPDTAEKYLGFIDK